MLKNFDVTIVIIAIIAVISEKTTQRNNWDTPSNSLRRRRSDAFRASSLLGDVLHFLCFPFPR